MTLKTMTAMLAALIGVAGPGADGPTVKHTLLMRAPMPKSPPPPSATLPHRDLNCIASAMWFEARGEPRRGQIAVAEVVMARTHDPRFPTTACRVVAQKRQFSFVHGGHVPRIPTGDASRAMEELARRVVDGVERSGIRHALFFHARDVHPGWKFVRLGSIGGHIFYGNAATSGA